VSVPTPSLIDTHAHLDDERFQDDLPAVVERARSGGVGKIVAVATTAASCHACQQLAATYPEIAPTAGLHPNHVAESKPGDFDLVADLVRQYKVVGVGETGLDRHWDFTPFAQQEENFARHLALARETALPIIIHCRDAEADVLRMLREQFDRHGPIRGVMHSFAGRKETADACLAMGLHISFAGMLTYKNAQDLRDVARTLPLDRLLVETDSPYLAPVPERGKRNEPCFVTHTASCLASLLGLDLTILAERTSANARALFELAPREGKSHT
jgi:TatD DNase family protein